MLRQYLTILIGLISLTCFAQKQKQEKTIYHIDNRIQKTLESNKDTGINTGFIEMKSYENDSLIYDNFGSPTKMPFYNVATIKQDTIHILGFTGSPFDRFGFYLDLNKESCSISYYTESSEKIYKLAKLDSTLKNKLYVPCSLKKLILVQPPTFKQGEIVEGVIELFSDTFYFVENDKENSYRMQLKMYFKTMPTRQ